MLRRAATVVATVLLLGASTCTMPEKTPPADSVLLNGVVITLDEARPEATAVAISGGRIQLVGGDESARRLIGPETRVSDLGGATLVPGLIDAHMHFFGVGLGLSRLDLAGTASLQQVLERVGRLAQETPAGEWIRGRGWDQNDWPGAALPTAAELDAVTPGHPVALTRIDGHALWVNSMALAEAGIEATTSDPPGGRIVRLPDGRPSGVLVDVAMDAVTELLAKPSEHELREAGQRAAEACFAAGLTSVHDAGLGPERIAAAEALLAAGRRLPRLYVMVSPGAALEALEASGPRLGEYDQRLTVRALKLYADGALGSRGAALLEPYADEPGNRGLMVLEPDELDAMLARAREAGIQPAAHAIGDRGNRVILDAYERVWPAQTRAAARLRLEHAQVLAPEDIERFAALGVIASMQPTHATSDMPWAESRLGAERVQGAYAWRRLLDAGARLAFGSDAPVESVKPLWGIYAAVTRQDHSGKPAGGWLPRERLGVEEALRLFTLDAAWSAFEEELKGSITPGKLADLVVLDRDIRKLPPEQLLETEVVATILGGETVHGVFRSDSGFRDVTHTGGSVRLEGQVALVTGAGTGIGRAVALALAREGAAVGLVGRRSETLARVAEAIAAEGGRGLPLRGDVSAEPDVERIVAALMESFGRLDILVNNAGLYHQGSALETTPEDWDRVFAVNLRGAWLVARRALREMLAARSGVVVNVSSSIGQRPIPGAAAYCASKAGLESLTRALALEVAAEGVRVNAVLPGIVDTPIHESREGFERTTFLSQAGQMHPLGRVGTPEDVASLVLYLATREASWITGALVNVDGGISLA